MVNSELEDKYSKYNFDDDEDDLEDKYSKYNFDDDEDEDEDSQNQQTEFKKLSKEEIENNASRIMEGTGFDMRFRKKNKKRRVKRNK